jgi:uncharacterized membrane-anchored protein
MRDSNEVLTAKVPEVTLVFWMIKIAATTLVGAAAPRSSPP